MARDNGTKWSQNYERSFLSQIWNELSKFPKIFRRTNNKFGKSIDIVNISIKLDRKEILKRTAIQTFDDYQKEKFKTYIAHIATHVGVPNIVMRKSSENEIGESMESQK